MLVENLTVQSPEIHAPCFRRPDNDLRFEYVHALGLIVNMLYAI